MRSLGNLLGREGEEDKGMDLELSSKLAVLLEQESLVKGYVEASLFAGERKQRKLMLRSRMRMRGGSSRTRLRSRRAWTS